MFAKVHPAEDVKSGNTGSCHDLVRYLEKETGEGQRFFSHTEQDISPERVIMDIDGNKKALGANDAKFFMLSLNPSQSEQMHLIGRKVDDFKELLREGADKISINTAAIMNPQLISDAADKFGSQCVVVAIDAKRNSDGHWSIYKNGGRVDMHMDAVEWAMKAEKLGAGEILLTSMDCDGTKAGYDIELTNTIASNVSIPVIASGGAGSKEHFLDAFTKGKADAALAASLFHYKELDIMELKKYLADEGIPMRLM